MRSTTQHPLALALAGALLASLTACGGDDDDDITPPPLPPTQPVPVTLQGSVMVNQGIQNAVVCMDLNANSVCDGNEPASAPTDASGAYTLTYDSRQISPAQVAAASLIAPLTTSATDAAHAGSATTQPYVLRQVPGKSGQINPLTTLVAKGIADGMSEGAARINTAVQLGIAEAKIDNYQDDPATNPAQVQDNARTMAIFTASALESGAVLQVGDPIAAMDASADDLASLAYIDKDNYTLRFFNNSAKAAGAPVAMYSDQRMGRVGGVPLTNASDLYFNAYLTPEGWRRCANDAQHMVTIGDPSRSVYCETNVSVGYSLYSDISGQSMASVIQQLQAAPVGNTINNGLPAEPLLTAVGAATFPAGSQLRQRMGLNLSQPLVISNTNTDARPQKEATTLEALIAAKPASAVNLATSAGTLTLGLSTSALRTLRVAFTGTSSPTDGTVQFYDCDLNAAQTAVSNCSATNTGTYHIDTVSGVRVMRFEGYAPTTGSSQINFYAEVKNTGSGDYVYRVRQAKPALALATTAAFRLNSTAWAALKAQLGL